MKGFRGFTLIELVIVIVIIGILAAVALPRFVDLTTSAKEASTKGGLGGIRATVALLYARNIATSGGTNTSWPGTADITANMQYGSPRNEVNNATTFVEVGSDPTVTTAGGWIYNTGNGKVWAGNDITW